jgi:hypothetical protein
MAIAEYLADEWNTLLGAERGTAKYIDHLSAARLSNVLWGLLTIPLVFFLFRRSIGDPAALLAAALVAFDTQHIANTRVAHIDGALTTLVLCCVTLFIESQRRRSLYLKILAGLAWGLCLSVKPTAISLVPGFLLINAIWLATSNRAKEDDSPPPLLAWSDLLAVVIGFLTLASLHTRFWDPNSKFVRVHHINPTACSWIVSISASLQAAGPMLEILSVCTFFLAVYCWFSKRTVPRHQRLVSCLPALLTIGSIYLLIGWFPTITSNLVRYFFWMFGLSEIPHRAYGVTIDPPVGGYLRIWFSRTTPWVSLGALFAVGLTIFHLIKATRWKWLQNHREMVSLILIAVLWTAFLSSSPKQAFRYVLPVSPFLAGFAAYGLLATTSALSRTLSSRFPLVLVGLLTIPQIYSAISVTPDYGLYFNSLSGGVRGAMLARASVPPVRFEKAFEEVEAVGRKEKRQQILEVAGDFNLLLASYRRSYLPDDRHISLVSYQGGLGSDWVINFPYFSNNTIRDFNRLKNLSLHFEYNVDGGTIFQLYRVNSLPSNTPIPIQFAETGRETGRLYHDSDTDWSSLELDVDTDRAGLGLYGALLKAPAGVAKLSVTMALHELRANPNAQILRLALSPTCKREIEIEEFGTPPSANIFKTFEITCKLSEPSRIEPTLFWFANQSVLVKSVAVEID